MSEEDHICEGKPILPHVLDPWVNHFETRRCKRAKDKALYAWLKASFDLSQRQKPGDYSTENP